MTVPGARSLRELFDAHGIVPTKSLGQNFVIDPNTVRKIAELAEVGPDDHVLEIGPGGGSLTAALAERAGKVTAVEIDARLLPVLRSVAEGPNVDIVEGDAMTVDLGAFGANKLVANLPYNIATPLVLRVLMEAPEIERLHVMTQREAGERLAAPPGSKTYGSASVMVAFHGRARVASKISRNAFYPVPNVDSVVVGIERVLRSGAPPAARVEQVVRAAFSMRRKTLRNCLASLAGSPGAAESWLEGAGISPGARAEDVEVEGYIALAELMPSDGTEARE